MTDSTIKMLELIYQKKSVNEITEELNISRKKLYNTLRQVKSQGYDIERKYYSSGDIIYKPKNTFLTYDGINIITDKDENILNVLVISDLHLGSEKQRLDKLNQAYDYCIKEGVHIIINCGDLIDGMFGPYKKLHSNIKEQIDYTIENHPFDKNILNFIILGDHDFNALQAYGLNIATILENYRHDIIPLGYGFGQLNIKNDSIFIRHPAPIFNMVKIEPTKMKNCLVLCGHSHLMKFNYHPSMSIFNIPTLSDLPGAGQERQPSAIHMTLEFTKGMITFGSFKYLIFDKSIYTISELNYDFSAGKDISGNKTIKFEENIINKKILTP